MRRRVSLREDAETYTAVGAAARDALLGALPADFEWDGARVLDFGCGAGRSLPHLSQEAARCAEFLACDIDATSIEWVQANLDPPFRAFVNGREPPLPLESGSLDLVTAVSVFTHLSESWSRWLLEMHRVLAPGGLLFASFMGAGVWHRSFAAKNQVEYASIGMLVEQPWGNFEGDHGPAVFHAPWWLREHWGRAFELLELREERFLVLPSGEHRGQGLSVWRRREGEFTIAELERPSDDPRELPALQLGAMLSRRESAHFVRAQGDRVASVAAEADALRAELEAVRASRIMRVSEPVRRLWYRLRSRFGRLR